MLVSGIHNVCKKGFFIAILSTNVETSNPEEELAPAFDLIGPVIEKFFTVFDFVIYFRFLMYLYQLTMVHKTISTYPVHSMPVLTMNLKPYKSYRPTNVSLERILTSTHYQKNKKSNEKKI